MKILTFCLYLTFFYSFGPAQASQKAKVIQTKALIYSDPYLKSVIGHLSLGKEILVSDQPYGNGRSFMLTIGNNVAYISIDSILTETGLFQKAQRIENNQKGDYQHPVPDSIDTNSDDDFTINNYFLFEIGSTSFIGGDWYKFNSTFLNRSPPVTQDFSMYIQHAPPQHSHSVSVGLSYLYQEDLVTSIKGPFLIGELNYELIENSIFNFAIGVCGYVSGHLTIKTGDPLKSYIGSVFGAGPKMTINFLPLSKFGFHITGRYQYYKAVNFDELEINGINQVVSFDEFSNFSVLLGLRIRVL